MATRVRRTGPDCDDEPHRGDFRKCSRLRGGGMGGPLILAAFFCRTRTTCQPIPLRRFPSLVN